MNAQTTEKQISYQFHTAMAVWYRAKEPVAPTGGTSLEAARPSNATLAAWHLEQAARAQA